MKILVYGAGAIGGYLGAILSAAGEDVTLVARGATHDAMASRGVILEGPKIGKPDPIKVRVVRPGAEKPPYDLIFVTLKSHQLTDAAQHVRALGNQDTIFVFPQNGLPWWHFDGIASKYRGTPLKTLDPSGVLLRTFDTAQIVGGVAFKPTDLLAPAHIRLADSPADSMTIGEVDNRMSERLQVIANITSNAGWKGTPVADIRQCGMEYPRRGDAGNAHRGGGLCAHGGAGANDDARSHGARRCNRFSAGCRCRKAGGGRGETRVATHLHAARCARRPLAGTRRPDQRAAGNRHANRGGNAAPVGGGCLRQYGESAHHAGWRGGTAG